MIAKTYFYGPGAAGTEFITTWDDFAETHIQDEGVAISIAEDIVLFGESWNNPDGEDIIEVYTVTDRKALDQALTEARKAYFA